MEKERSQRILFQFDDFKQAIGPLTFKFKVTIKSGYSFGKFFFLIHVPSLVEKSEKLSELEG